MKLMELLGCTEDFQVPSALMRVFEDESSQVDFMNRYAEECEANGDALTAYFQKNQADRKSLMQDFTPKAVCELTSLIIGKQETVIDVCSGIGGLTVAQDADFLICEELSNNALPFLLLQLCVNNKDAIVLNKDVLTNDVKRTFKVEKGDRFATVYTVDGYEPRKADACVTNPPYSLKFENVEEYENDERFSFGLTPKPTSDFLFVQHGLHSVKDGGVLVAILPHGVLFRGAKEAKIREALIRESMIEAVIGLPAKLFANTDIPTIVLVLRKGREESGVFFIDASNECEHVKSKNVMRREHVLKIAQAYSEKKNIDKFAHYATIGEIERNGMKLNIPRYVDTFEKVGLPPISQTMKELVDVENEINQKRKTMLDDLKRLYANDVEKERDLKKAISDYERIVNYEPDMRLFC